MFGISNLLRIERRDEQILEDVQKKITSIESELAESMKSFNYLTITSSRHNSKQTDEIASLAQDIRAIAKSVDELVHTRCAVAHAVGEVAVDTLPPAGCSAAAQSDRRGTVQRIRASPHIGANTFYVLCSAIDDKRPYTVILNRNSAALEFHRNWDEYRNGFGNVAGDHWIGLERLSEVRGVVFYTLLAEFGKKLSNLFVISIS